MLNYRAGEFFSLLESFLNVAESGFFLYAEFVETFLKGEF